MTIAANKVVTFHYRLSEGDGAEIETTFGDEPMAYLHGHDNMVSGLEKAMEGKSAGDKFTVTLTPEEGYGARIEDGVQRIPLKHLHVHGKPRAGMIAWVETEQGPRQVTILKVGKFNVDADINHPLAGKTLTFEVEIMELRDASPEEIEHGHVHGPGGHHH